MEDNRRAQELLALVAVYLVVDLLLLAPVLVIAFKWPNLIWFAFGPYLFITLAAIALLVYLAWRWGLMEFTGTDARSLRRAAMGLGIPTVVYVGVLVVWPETVAAATVAYCLVISYTIYRLVKWEATHLAFVCQVCGAVFTAAMTVWLLSPNMGTRKWVTCAACGKHTLAKIVDAKAAPTDE